MLVQKKFGHVVPFYDGKKCLANMTKMPQALIIEDHLKSMTGLQFIQKAKTAYPGLFVVLLSGGNNDFTVLRDERFILYVDKFILKGMNDMNELVDALVHCRTIRE
jgi:CheY-like chemotaxis protein